MEDGRHAEISPIYISNKKPLTWEQVFGKDDIKQDEENINLYALIVQTCLHIPLDDGQRLYEQNPDGYYGPKTVQTVKKYQKKKGLKATGIVDDATKKALFDDYATLFDRGMFSDYEHIFRGEGD